MKIEKKVLLYGLGIFLVGIIVGAVAGGTLVGRYQRKVPLVPATKSEFMETVYNIIKPTDLQKPKLESCIENTADKIVTINITYREHVISVIDSMYNCFSHNLRSDQQNNFKVEFNNLIIKHNRLKNESK